MSCSCRMRPTDRVSPGTTVGVPFGGRVVKGSVIEDRGIFRHHRIVRVRIGDVEGDDAIEFELPVEELQPLPSAA